MFIIAGYEYLEKIHDSLITLVYKARRIRDRQIVIIKVLKKAYPSSQDIYVFKHQYELMKDLDSEGIIKAYSLEKSNNYIAIVLEDFGGNSLKKLIQSGKCIDLFVFLQISIGLTKALEEVHKLNIIHKDIKPDNIIINDGTLKVKIADFSIASLLTQEKYLVSNPDLLEGTLAYMSPEQTGRMNRAIDYRTDFYSLGVTFYEMLTRQLPFPTIDAMELVHSHIAKIPALPHEVDPTIPKVISDIVMKLLAKTAEDRYQSAYGIKADLEACLTQLQTNGRIENFILGQHDVFAKFQIPQKLYGRDGEIATLNAAFERTRQGKSEMILVSGYSGIGKTALISEIDRQIVRRKGYFTSGKCDQFKRGIPYAAMIQAFQHLIRQLLTESKEKVEIWQNKLLKALGTNGRVIIDVIPELELIIGLQPPVPQLEPGESQNRFYLVFQKLLGVFTTQKHPLVLFIDDLQWVDSASLKLLQLLMMSSDSQYFLLIGAYRDNEVNETHPLMFLLDEIKKAGVKVNQIDIQPLNTVQVNQLIADTLHCELETAFSLAKIVFNKTAGNPFFVTQIIKTFYQENLLSFDLNAGSWQWDVQKIKEVKITDNVVELMVNKIQKLPNYTQSALKVAACIGNTFTLNDLAIVNEKSLSSTANELWQALQEDFIFPLSGAYKIPLTDDLNTSSSLVEKIENQSSLPHIEYKFLHDRVQQAAYFLIPAEQKKEIHLKVGQLLLKNTKTTEIEDKIFDIVNHLNIAIELITSEKIKQELAELNLLSARKAKAAAAYELAQRYLNFGLELLAEDSWHSNYKLTFSLYIEAVEIEYLNGNFENSTSLGDIVLRKATSFLEKVKTYEIKIQFYISLNQMQAALDTSLLVLEMLGEPLVEKLPEELDIGNLSNLPEMADPDKLAAMRILVKAITPAYVMNPALLPPIVFTMVNICIRHGNSSLSAFAYTFYGLILCTSIDNIEIGYQFGQLGINLVKKLNAKEVKAKVYELFYGHIKHWVSHARETIEPLQETVQYGLESGDLEYASYAATYTSVYPFFVGEYLNDVCDKQTIYTNLLINLKQNYFGLPIIIWRQLVLKLLNKNENECRAIGNLFDEEAMLPIFTESNNGALLFSTYFSKSIFLYLLQNYAEAVSYAKLAERYSGYLAGVIHTGEQNFYYSMILLARCSFLEESEREINLQQVELNQIKLKKWSLCSPRNYEHKYYLIEAEKAKFLGHILPGMEYYDRAILGAKKQGYIHEEAIANERASEFYRSLGREKIAQTYLVDSYYCYVRWGAIAKVKDLELRYPQLLSLTSNETSSRELTVTTSSASLGTKADILDLATIIKASQALAGEIVLDKFLDKLLKVLMENAGAQTSCLVLETDGILTLKATGTVEQEKITLWSSTSLDNSQNLPVSLINYVARTKENIVLNNAAQEGIFIKDSYIIKAKVKSILCVPVINQNKLIGIIYLENNLTVGAFTSARLEIVKILSTQIVISLENALLYKNLEEYSRTLEEKVEERTFELSEKNDKLKRQAIKLQKALDELRQAQAQLIQTEKMSSLGQLVAGVAHEINNPVNFIYGNLNHAKEYSEQLLHLIDLYQHSNHSPKREIQDYIEEIDFEYLLEDLPKIFSSMQLGATRIGEIVLSLRNFSRLDEADMKSVDIHEGIESTLLILQNRLNKKADRSAIQVIKKYAKLPLVECYPGQLNQVFMNILTNAIDALEDRHRPQTQIKEKSSTIIIVTEVINCDWIRIRIADNGTGVTEEVLTKLFDPFFTTKPVGSGTGLGLSISYQIVVEKHGGQVQCISAPGQGAEFIIDIPIKPKNSQKSSPVR
ncbi:trifunctional serine/threonine-protein kinase/ATP-binding protein/sensor histidine kinase [Microcoleus asticus]|uniref:histidine kinase n=1 Tax=Microcoleus asticus IPMA8 TaxID=2563858 RepID=A0ABX2D384_9CYAN|nr:ATP-binding sensor histidine kinase [Microcoleus asticus]NQE37106.1 Serine/threonine-protein kinase PknB [Microcoleus asticus IPMA8]